MSMRRAASVCQLLHVSCASLRALILRPSAIFLPIAQPRYSGTPLQAPGVFGAHISTLTLLTPSPKVQIVEGTSQRQPVSLELSHSARDLVETHNPDTLEFPQAAGRQPRGPSASIRQGACSNRGHHRGRASLEPWLGLAKESLHFQTLPFRVLLFTNALPVLLTEEQPFLDSFDGNLAILCDLLWREPGYIAIMPNCRGADAGTANEKFFRAFIRPFFQEPIRCLCAHRISASPHSLE